MASDFQQIDAVIPAGAAGTYAPQVITFGQGQRGGLLGVTALLESLGAATGATVELWMCAIGKDPLDPTSYVNCGAILSAVGYVTLPFAGYPAVQLRVRSGGAAGTVNVSASAD